MSPLTTPYLGRVARGDMTAVRTSSPALGTNGLCGEGLNASRRGLMPLSLPHWHFPYFQYVFCRCVGLGECTWCSGRNSGLGAIRDGAGLK
jgi:hypothetical protein